MSNLVNQKSWELTCRTLSSSRTENLDKLESLIRQRFYPERRSFTLCLSSVTTQRDNKGFSF